MRRRLLALAALLALSACRPSAPAKREAATPPVASPTQAEAPPASPQSETVNPPPSETRLSVEQARVILASATKTFVNDPDTWLELALFEFKANNAPEGERLLKEIHKRFPKYARAPYRLGLHYDAQRRLVEAAEFLDIAAKLAPDDAAILSAAGVAQLNLGNETKARQYGEQAIKSDAQRSEAYLLLARVNDHPGTDAQAIAYADQYIKYAPAPSAGYYFQGRVFARQAKKDEAIAALTKARDADPNNPKIWLLMGRVYYELYRNAKEADALQCLQKALELDPSQWEAHQWIGKYYAGKNNYTDAVTQLQEALRLSPEPGSLYYDLGQALMKSGKIAEGQKMLQRHQDYQDFARLMGQLTAAATKEPNNKSIRYDMARLCLKYHQPQGAVTLINEAEHILGTDATFQTLRQQAQAETSAPANFLPPNPAPPTGGSR